MNEEIIIERGCVHCSLCSEDEECYLNRCKRLKQERDELKFENDRYKQLLKGCPAEDEDCGFCEIDKQNKRLKQENKELGRKAFLAEQNVQTTAATFCEKDNKIKELEQENNALQAYKDINEDFKKAWDELNEKHKQLRSALEEIREIAKFNQFYNPEDLLINGDIGQIQDLKMTEIYNKINECLGE